MPRIEFDGPAGHEAIDIPWSTTTATLRLTLAEVRHIQRVADMKANEVRDKIFATDDPDPIALTALVQVLWKRQGRVVSFEDVDFDLGSFSWDLLPDEEAAMRAQVAKARADGADVPDEIAGFEDPTLTPSGGQTEAA